MKLSEVYDEIILRAGEGYDAYEDRAKEMFWKAVSTLIKKGDYNHDEIRRCSQRYTKQIGNSDFSSGSYKIYKMWSSTADPKVSRFFTNEIFDYDILIEPVVPGEMRFQRVPIDEMAHKAPLNLLNDLSGLPELIWAFDFPDLLITQNSPTFRGTLILSARTIPRTAIANDNTDTDNYFDYSFLVRAMELAAQLLKTETE